VSSKESTNSDVDVLFDRIAVRPSLVLAWCLAAAFGACAVDEMAEAATRPDKADVVVQATP